MNTKITHILFIILTFFISKVSSQIIALDDYVCANPDMSDFSTIDFDVLGNDSLEYTNIDNINIYNVEFIPSFYNNTFSPNDLGGQLPIFRFLKGNGTIPPGSVDTIKYALRNDPELLTPDTGSVFILFDNSCVSNWNETLSSLDSDNDGVIDNLDLDDDNDGILDTTEGHTICPLTISSGVFFEENTTINENTPILTNETLLYNGLPTFGNTTFDLSFGEVSTPTEYSVRIQENMAFWIGNSDAIISDQSLELIYSFSEQLNIEIDWPQGSFHKTEKYLITFDNNTQNVTFSENGSGITFSSMGTNSYLLEAPTFTSEALSQLFLIKAKNVKTVTFKRIDIPGNIADKGGLRISGVNLGMADFDNDGIPNHLDLDSDNDGIPDIIEAQNLETFELPTFNNESTYLSNDGVNSSFLGGLTPIQTSSQNPDFLNINSDGDSFFDIYESGLNNQDDNHDGMVDMPLGVNGLVNENDSSDNYQFPYGKIYDPINQLTHRNINTGRTVNFRLTGPNTTTFNDTICVASNTPLILPIILNDSINGSSINESDIANLAIIIPPAFGSLNVNPINFNITYTPNSDIGRRGLDQFIYEVEDIFGFKDSATVFLNFNKFDLPLSPIDTICNPTVNIIGDSLTPTGYWDYNELEINVSDSSKSNADVSLLIPSSIITWKDSQFGCPDINIELAQDSITLSPTIGSINICSKDDFVNLNDIYSFSVSELSTQNWYVDGILLNEDTLRPSEYSSGSKFHLKFEVTRGLLCNATFEDSVSINSLDAGFDLADTLCLSSEMIDLDTTAFDQNSSPTFESLWYMNSVPFNGIVSLNIAGTYDIAHVVNYNGCKDSVVSRLEILAPPSANFRFVDTDGDKIFCTNAETVQVNTINPDSPGGIWSLNSFGTTIQDSITEVSFSTLSSQNLYKLRYIVSNGCVNQKEESFFLAEGFSADFDSLVDKCNSDPILNFENSLNPVPISSGTTSEWFLDNSVTSSSSVNYSTLSIGEHSLTHFVKNLFCNNTVTKAFKVDSIKTSSYSGLEIEYCNTEPTLDLNTLTRFNSGNWYINDSLLTEIRFDTFPPNTIQELKHLVINGACVDSTIQSFDINLEEDPNFSGLAPLYCSSDTLFTNTLLPVNTGGTWTINGNNTPVTEISLSPLLLSTPNTISYSLISGACLSDSTLEFNISEKSVASIPVSFNTNYCELDSTLKLMPFSTDSLWYINGVLDSTFTALDYRSDGTAQIEFIVGSDICSDTSSAIVSIDTVIDALFIGVQEENCITDASISLSSLTSSSNYWELDGSIITDSLKFSTLSSGMHMLKHRITNGLCVDIDSLEFNISTPLNSNFTLDLEYCENKDSIVYKDELSPLTPGGNWFLNDSQDSSNSVLFSTESKDVVHSLRYEVTNGSCKQSTTIPFTINSIPDTVFTGLKNSYCNLELIIINELNPVNSFGTWFNNGTILSEDTVLLTTSSSNTLRYEVTNGVCRSSSSQNYEVLDRPDASFILNELQYCENQDSIDLQSIATIGEWYLNTFDNDIQYLKFSSDLSGSNSLFHIIDNGTCIDTAFNNFHVDTITPATWIMNSIFCTGDPSIDLDASYPLSNDNWSIESSSINTLDFNSLSAGNYNIVRQTTNGECQDSDSLTIEINETPSITVSQFGSICKYIPSKDLSLQLSSQVYETKWFINGEELLTTNLVPNNYETGDTLQYEIINEQCSQTGFEILSIIDAQSKQSLSLSSTDFMAKIPFDSATSIYFDLSPESTVQQVQDSLLITVTDFISANVLIVELDTVNNICPLEIDYIVFFEPEISISAGPDTTYGFEISSFNLEGTITSTGSGKWTYESPDGAEVWIGNDTLPNTQINILTPGTVNFIWSVITPSGQILSDTALITLLNLKIPEGFSPNGDNINDVFEIIGLEDNSKIHLTVLNRWGQVVYEDPEYNGLWDGTDMNTGEQLPNDSYIYRIKIQGLELRSGTVIIKE